MKKTKWGLLLGLLLVGGSLFVGQKQPSQPTKPQVRYQYQVKKPRVISYSAGEKRWDLAAQLLLKPKTKNKTAGRIILKQITEGKLFVSGKVEYRLDAEKIIYYNQSKNVTLVNNVTLNQITGQVITTSKLRWINAENLLKTNHRVRVELANGGQITAGKMRAQVKEKIIELDNQVKTRFVVKGVDDNAP